jgi:hypothetical protein
MSEKEINRMNVQVRAIERQNFEIDKILSRDNVSKEDLVAFLEDMRKRNLSRIAKREKTIKKFSNKNN